MRIAIIGAGATGLTIAHRLSNEHEITLYEKNDLGGMAGAVPLYGTAIDKFYRHIFTNDEYIINLIEEMGLSGEMLWKPAKNGMYLDTVLYPFTNPIDLILFPKVSFIGRLRMGLAVLGAKNIKDYKEMEKINAREWLVKKTGQNVYKTIWEPLLYSKFDKDAENVSGVWIWNKFKLRGSTRRGVNKEYLGYLRGGFIKLYEKMAKGLPLVREAVIKIEKKGNQIEVVTDKNEAIYDKVFFTGAAESLTNLYPFPEEYHKKLNMQKHKANICMTLILSKPLSEYYWITIAEKNAPFVLIIEHTQLYDDPAYNGKKIVYLSRYLDAADPLFAQDDENISNMFLNYLQKIFPDFNKNDIEDRYIHRERYSQPVVFKHHSENIMPFETPIENLYMVNMGQIYPQDRGQNYAVMMGEKAADIIHE